MTGHTNHMECTPRDCEVLSDMLLGAALRSKVDDFVEVTLDGKGGMTYKRLSCKRCEEKPTSEQANAIAENVYACASVVSGWSAPLRKAADLILSQAKRIEELEKCSACGGVIGSLCFSCIEDGGNKILKQLGAE